MLLKITLWQCWYIWHCQNEKVWDGIEKPAIVSFNLAKDYILPRRNSSKSRIVGAHSHIVSQGASISQWKKPTAGTLKCNIDTTIFQQEKTVGRGACIDNVEGAFVASIKSYRTGVLPALEARTSLLVAITWVHDLMLQNVVFKMDCKYFFDSLHSPSSMESKLGTVIRAYKNAVTLISNSSLSLIPRQVVRNAMDNSGLRGPDLLK